jgi:hypothetical protein
MKKQTLHATFWFDNVIERCIFEDQDRLDYNIKVGHDNVKITELIAKLCPNISLVGVVTVMKFEFHSMKLCDEYPGDCTVQPTQITFSFYLSTTARFEFLPSLLQTFLKFVCKQEIGLLERWIRLRSPITEHPGRKRRNTHASVRI